MTFWDHLDELRSTILRSGLVLFLLSCVGLVFKKFLFDGLVLAPSRPDFCIWRLLGTDFRMSLINTDVSAQFFAHLRASVGLGFVLSFPFIIWEVWKFVAPALYASEKHALRSAFLFASLLFYIGVAVGYFSVFPMCLQFFMNYSVSDAVENTITLQSYMSLFTSMVLLVGLVFEFPTVVVALSRMGVLDRSVLRKGRRYAVVVILVLAAVITPADPVSMIILAVPMYLLYEMSILLCKSSKQQRNTA